MRPVKESPDETGIRAGLVNGAPDEAGIRAGPVNGTHDEAARADLAA
ncbi:MAG: hypothetical protein ACR2J6_02950 [Thermoleophilaceae bacterium]